MKHFQVLGFSHDDQDVSCLEDIVAADMVVMFPIADDSEAPHRQSSIITVVFVVVVVVVLVLLSRRDGDALADGCEQGRDEQIRSEHKR